MNWSSSPYPFTPRPLADRPIVVGLVNNISDRGLRATEAQFMRVLRGAAGDSVTLRCFTCPEVPRATTPQTIAGEGYLPFTWLFDMPIDALIVTGSEPRATHLQDEPIWPSVVRLVEWSEAHAVPTMWSCLAAHAAVLHLDGISRVRMPKKLSGLFDCETVHGDHPLTNGLGSHHVCPHSRYFDLPEASLAASGYQILVRSSHAGADTFTRTERAPFIFFQGHPEYDPDSLLREYMRDIGRYARGEREEYPIVPTAYFPDQIECALTELRSQALRSGRPARLMETVSGLIGGTLPSARWHGWAARIYANWLAHAVQVKTRCWDGNPWHKPPAVEAMLPQ